MTDKPENLIVSPNPHIRTSATTSKIMMNVIIALLPTVVGATIIFGPRALLLILVTVAACVAFEAASRRIMKRTQTVGDMSAIVTGLLLSFNLPSNLPFYMAVIGAFIAIVIVKQLFGGLGQNFANPAIVARIALMLAFTPQMTAYPQPFEWNAGTIFTTAVTAPTPLAAGESGGVVPDLFEMFIGMRGGVLGETCAVALLLGFLYLLVLRTVDPVTPLCYIGVVALLTAVSGDGSPAGGNVLTALLSGGLVLGALFMATDYATTPLSKTGKAVFGIGCGIITFVVREFASMPEGVSFSILIMNILTPLIEQYTARREPASEKV